MSSLDLHKFEENIRKYADQVVDNLMKSDTTAILSEEDIPDDRLMEILKENAVMENNRRLAELIRKLTE